MLSIYVKQTLHPECFNTSCIFPHLRLHWLSVFALRPVEVPHSVRPENAKVIGVVPVQCTSKFITTFVFLQTHLRRTWMQCSLLVAFLIAHHTFTHFKAIATSLE